MIQDDHDLGSDDFLATRPLQAKGNGVGAKKITAVPVPEHVTEKYSIVLRFMFTISESMHVALNTWVDVPRHKGVVVVGQIFFARGTEDDAPMHKMKSNLEYRLSETINCLTTGQRCAG